MASRPVSASWPAFETAAPEIAAAGRRLLAAGEGVAFLATVRKDRGPRVHPVMPVLGERGLHVFVVNMSYKYRDLQRDPRHSLHASLPAGGGEEFYITGDAVRVDDPARREEVIRASGNRLGHNAFEVLFELRIDRALYTRWQDWGTASAWPEFHKWASP